MSVSINLCWLSCVCGLLLLLLLRLIVACRLGGILMHSCSALAAAAAASSSAPQLTTVHLGACSCVACHQVGPTLHACPKAAGVLHLVTSRAEAACRAPLTAGRTGGRLIGGAWAHCRWTGSRRRVTAWFVRGAAAPCCCCFCSYGWSAQNLPQHAATPPPGGAHQLKSPQVPPQRLRPPPCLIATAAGPSTSCVPHWMMLSCPLASTTGS